MLSFTEKPKSPHSGLHVSAYDQVSGALIAGLLLFGFVVGLLSLIWISSRTWLPTASVPVTMLKPDEVGGGGRGLGDGERFVAQQFDEPAAEEMPPVAETRAEDTINAISLAVSTPEAEPLTLGELSSSSGNSDGPGNGDNRGPGPPGIGTLEGTPPWDRWEVRLNATTLEEYARQLDFFKIELAAAGGGSSVVTYVSQVSTPKPSVRTGSPQTEKRLRFMHREGVLRDADRRLVNKAGVDPTGQVVFQFYSDETYTALRSLESTAQGQRPLSEVRRTIFGVREVAGRYEFFVIGQEYR